MRIFYDSDGNVVGSIEGATDEIEAGFGLPTGAAGATAVSPEVVDRINDPADPLNPHQLQVEDGSVVLPDEG